ncbi:MAG: YHS domain-containing protein [Armatimonadota bacterium]|nr:YHS domain-containing protein [Armatimonadota bacterium]
MCPVTGTKIASAKAAYAHETYKGKTYYFCCPMCKPAFDKAPDKIIANAKKGKYQPM